MEQYSRSNPMGLKVEEVEQVEIPQIKESDQSRQVGLGTNKDSNNSVMQKPNLKRKRTPTPQKSNK